LPICQSGNEREHFGSEGLLTMRKQDQCPRVKINRSYCTCTFTCDKHALCCECLHYHRQRGELPACYFTAEEEKTYNRSIEFFIQRRNKR
jgi:hypothetical protein